MSYKGIQGVNSPTSATTDVNTRKYDVSEQLFLLDRYNNPLTTFLTTVGKTKAPDGQSYKGKGIMEKETIDPEFKIFEDTMGQTAFVLADTGTNLIGSASEETLTVDDGLYNLNVGDVLLNSINGDIYYVKSIASDTEAEVERGIGTTALATAAADDVLILTGNAARQGDDSVDSSHTVKTQITGYTQIFKTNFGVTGSLENTELYTGSEFELQKRKKAIEHAMKIERALIWGKKGKAMVTIGGVAQLAYTTDGIINRISGLQTDVTGAMDESEWIDYLESLFTYSSASGSKYVVGGGGVVSDIQAFTRASNNTMQLSPGASKLGVKVFEYESAFGDVKILNHPMFSENATYTNQAMGLDFDTIKMRYLKNRKAVYKENVQGPGADAMINQYLSDVGLELSNSARSRMLTIGN